MLEHEKIIFSKYKQKIIGELDCCEEMKYIIMKCV